ncbi:MAG: aldehyde dehydrogenase family protein [Planctomycetota bacterium]
MFNDVLERLGLTGVQSGVAFGTRFEQGEGPEIDVINPSTAGVLGRVRLASVGDYENCVQGAREAFERWRLVPPPARGELIRRLGERLRKCKSDLGLLVTLETGKIRTEGEGEVQEMIDMCDFAVGLSRQLYGLTIASERPEHRMMEQWHPLGPMGIITAFNFPVAVWAWNAAVAAVCGNAMIWKPAPQTPLTAIAVHKIVCDLMAEFDCAGVFNLCFGDVPTVGERMAADRRLPLISATGSCAMGRRVGQVVAGRLGRSLLELGGNNGVIVAPSADLALALRGVLFAAVGTAGQRCTSLRRLFLHDSIADAFLRRLTDAYRSVRIGDPWESGILMGPLIDEKAVERMMNVLERARAEGGEIITGGRRLERPGFFVEPTVVRATAGMSVLKEETFAPILHVLTYSNLDEAIAVHNSVDQGLSSAIFTNDLGGGAVPGPGQGDCGIANVNMGTSGAEIGGAFGGEKDTGGGREAGSDAWKAYMRRQTCTINRGSRLPLAQGVSWEGA